MTTGGQVTKCCHSSLSLSFIADFGDEAFAHEATGNEFGSVVVHFL